MAVIRFRRKNVCIALLLVCIFFSTYLLLSLPPKGDLMSFPGQHDSEVEKAKEKSISRKHFTTTLHVDHEIEVVKNVIAAPQLFPQDSKIENDSKVKVTVHPEQKGKDVATSGKAAGAQVIGILAKNKTYELGAKLWNKTMQVGERLKNKTLEQLAVMGIAAPKQLPQLVFVKQKWNLTVSFEDIGDIMKETQFLNKIDPLNLNGPVLLSSRNRTANFMLNMPVKFGFCDCFERYCFCCSQIINKRLHLNSTACFNFTFVSKIHQLDLQFSLDGKPVHKALISADRSPLLCMGSTPKVADICVHFFNVSFKVNQHNAPQTQLLGCTDLSLNLYNKTIGAFPVDCFQIPGDPNKVHKERNFNNMFNWMP